MVRYMFHKKWNVFVDFIHFSQKIFWQKVILVSDLWTCARSRRRRRTSSTWTRSTTSAPWHAHQVPSMSFDSNNPSLPIIYYKPLLFMSSCMWIGKLFNSHIFGTNLTYCHWFEHNGKYFLNFLRRFSGFWKSICQRPSWISWSFRNNLSMEYTMYIIHARKYSVMICEVTTTGGKDLKLTKGEFFKQSTILNIFYRSPERKRTKINHLCLWPLLQWKHKHGPDLQRDSLLLDTGNVLFRQTKKKLEN